MCLLFVVGVFPYFLQISASYINIKQLYLMHIYGDFFSFSDLRKSQKEACGSLKCIGLMMRTVRTRPISLCFLSFKFLFENEYFIYFFKFIV